MMRRGNCNAGEGLNLSRKAPQRRSQWDRHHPRRRM